MRIALAQINPIVGDITGNMQQIQLAIEAARLRHADLVVFPELAIIGYPPRDLLMKPSAIDMCQQALEQIASSCTDIAAIVGYPCPSQTDRGLALFNAAALCFDGKIQHSYAKNLLPTYDVFDERRYFEPGYRAHEQSNDVAVYKGIKIGVTICEDLWADTIITDRQLYHKDPVGDLVKAGAQIIVNCSASPFVMGKHDTRLKLLQNTAQKHHVPVFYCNQVGGNDELVFDGNSCAVDATGKLI
ncbi:MAG: hypothetical protein JKX85_04550, partial [Phycisphaeraceae bacterium]|nr:hypothetical protein [Phycisphaeraceae bacterium]